MGKIGDSGSQYGTTVLETGVWYHAILFYDKGAGVDTGQAKVYLNGVGEHNFVTGITFDGTLEDDIFIGSEGGTAMTFDGNIDEVAIFDCFLESAERLELYNSGIPLNLYNHSKVANISNWWRMGEGDSPDIITDIIGGKDGVMYNMDITNIVDDTPMLDGTINFANEKSLIFDGVEEYVNVPGPAIDITDPFTLSAWIKLDTIPSGDPYSVMSNADEWTEGGYRLTINTNGSIKVDHYNVALVKAFYALTDDTGLFVVDTWYHISVTKSGATVKIYKDGESLAVTDSSPYTGTASQYTDLQIGAQLNDGTPRYFFDGSIDEVSIWGHSLSESEIEELYNTGVPLNLKLHSQVGNLISWWRMGEGDVPNIITDNHGSSATDGTMIEMDASNIVDDTP